MIVRIENNYMGEKRILEPKIGEKYKVVPMNIASNKHRDRICTLLGLDDDFMPQKGTVLWEDTGGKGKVDLCDIVPFE